MAHTIKKMTWLAVLLVGMLFASGCFGLVIDQEHVAQFPEKTFAKARQHLADLARSNPGRHGESSELHLLVYEGKDHELTRITVPNWALNMVEADTHQGRQHKSADHEGDRYVKRYVDVDELDLHSVLRLGPGLVLEVDDNGDDTHVLIWLE